MKPLLAVAAVLVVPPCSFAQAQVAKACDDLKSEIATKLDAKGVKGYTLEVVTKEKEVSDGKVVGTCEGGTKKIVYSKGTASTPASTPQTPAKEKEPGKPE